jgi:hypothetical protein
VAGLLGDLEPGKVWTAQKVKLGGEGPVDYEIAELVQVEIAVVWQ